MTTNFKAGGYRPGIVHPKMRAPRGWCAPSFIDNRGYCLSTDDQGRSSACVGFSMAGLIEVRMWMKTHVPVQVDGLALYNRAKEIDADGQDGTGYDSIVAAAKGAGLIPVSAVVTSFTTYEEYLFALHSAGAVLCGLEITSMWNQCDSVTGWVPAGGDSIGGHSLLSCWYSQTAPDGVGFQNSWGGMYGVRGFCRLSREQFEEQLLDGISVVW